MAQVIVNTHKGYWENSTKCEGHWFDMSLARELLFFFNCENAKSIVDFGCGSGDYVKFLLDNGFNIKGYDGNPNTPLITNNICEVLDLSIPHTFNNKFDWVMSLEVGEHLPQVFEDIFINNLHNNNNKGIILSWAKKGQGGAGHFNEQDNEYIKDKFSKLGYINDIFTETILREKSQFGWFKNTLMVFRKK